MICYLDKTFCCNPDCTCGEYRRLTDEVRAAADKWWAAFGSDDPAPIAVSDFCGAKPEVTS